MQNAQYAKGLPRPSSRPHTVSNLNRFKQLRSSQSTPTKTPFPQRRLPDAGGLGRAWAPDPSSELQGVHPTGEWAPPAPGGSPSRGRLPGGAVVGQRGQPPSPAHLPLRSPALPWLSTNHSDTTPAGDRSEEHTSELQSPMY